MSLNFNSVPITNATQCVLWLYECSVTLPPNAATVLNCALTRIFDERVPVQEYIVTETRNFSTPSFGAVTACTPEVVVFTIWTPSKLSAAADVSAEELRFEFERTIDASEVPGKASAD